MASLTGKPNNVVLDVKDLRVYYETLKGTFSLDGSILNCTKAKYWGW
jgi:hypothetical protein